MRTLHLLFQYTQKLSLINEIGQMSFWHHQHTLHEESIREDLSCSVLDIPVDVSVQTIIVWNQLILPFVVQLALEVHVLQHG